MVSENITVEKLDVKVQEFAKKLELDITYEGRGIIPLSSISVSRPGLQIAGHYKHFDHTRVLVIGYAEHEYLQSLPTEIRRKVADELLKREVPCLIFSRGLEIFDEFLEIAKEYKTPLLKSEKITTVLVNDITTYQSEILAPTEVMHGVLMDIFGIGILIKGKSGIGKSEIALELVNRGHRLVADDSVIIKNINDQVVGRSPENIRYYMEIRGIGIIDVQRMFGPGSIRPEKRIDIIAELSPWEEGKNYDRIGTEENYDEILGIKIQKVCIPVTPGRNIPVVLETAARKFRLKQAGHDPAQKLMEEVFGKEE